MKASQKQEVGSKSRKVALGLILLASLGLASGYAQDVASVTTEAPVAEKSWSKKVFGREDWASIEHAYESPREICRVVESNIRYKTEKADQWSAAGETWGRGAGDCEDFAIMIQKLCQISGFETKVHLYFPATGGREGHAVLVGEWNGKMWLSSNGSYVEVKSEQEVRQRVARMLSCKEKQLWGMKMNDRDVVRYIEKGAPQSVATAAR